MRTMFKTLLILLLSITVLKAQGNDPDSSEVNKSDRKKYLALSNGLTYATYRDFATSPLFYEGPGLHLGFGWIKETRKWENIFEANFNFSAVLAMAPLSEYFQTDYASIFINNQLYNSYLRNIDAWRFRDYQVQIGGVLMSDFNARINTNLQNAAGGIEALANLMVAGKIEKDFSTAEAIDYKIWFLKRSILPAQRKLSFQLNAGILNMNWRPGYAYLADSELNGTDTNAFDFLFSSHSWSLNGWRLSTRLEYSKIRPTGNGVKISYIWDAVHAPGKFESFQMASHSIRYALIINSNKK